MAKKIYVHDRQSIWDIAIQEYGGIDGVFDLIKANKSIENLNTEIQAGQVLNISGEAVNKDVLDYYQNKQVRPVTSPATEGDFNDDFNDDFYI